MLLIVRLWFKNKGFPNVHVYCLLHSKLLWLMFNLCLEMAAQKCLMFTLTRMNRHTLAGLERKDRTVSICYLNSLQIFLIILCLHDVISRKVHPKEAIFIVGKVLESNINWLNRLVWVVTTVRVSCIQCIGHTLLDDAIFSYCTLIQWCDMECVNRSQPLRLNVYIYLSSLARFVFAMNIYITYLTDCETEVLLRAGHIWLWLRNKDGTIPDIM